LPPCNRTPLGDEWKQQLREFCATVQRRMSTARGTQDMQTNCNLTQQLIDKYETLAVNLYNTTM